MAKNIKTERLWTVQSKELGVHSVWTSVDAAIGYADWLARNWDDRPYFVRSISAGEMAAEGWGHMSLRADKHWWTPGYPDLNSDGYAELEVL